LLGAECGPIGRDPRRIGFADLGHRGGGGLVDIAEQIAGLGLVLLAGCGAGGRFQSGDQRGEHGC
jgi:hypothetical protein